MLMVPCVIIYSMKQPTDAPICSHFYFTARFTTCFRCFIHPSSGAQFLTVSTAADTNHSIVSATYSQCGLVLTPSVNEWWITKLGTASRKEHKYSSFCRSSKRCGKKWGSTHQQRQLATVCVDDVFHRNFSSAVWTDQHILPTTLSRTSRT